MKRWFILFAVSALVGCASHPSSPSAQAGTKESGASAAKAPAPAPTGKKEASEAKSDSAKLECTLGEDVRTLELAKKEEGCELTYLKFKKSKVIATSEKGTAHCEEVRDKTRKHLEKAGFSCK